MGLITTHTQHNSLIKMLQNIDDIYEHMSISRALLVCKDDMECNELQCVLKDSDYPCGIVSMDNDVEKMLLDKVYPDNIRLYICSWHEFSRTSMLLPDCTLYMVTAEEMYQELVAKTISHDLIFCIG
jgi:hypothetical protein